MKVVLNPAQRASLSWLFDPDNQDGEPFDEQQECEFVMHPGSTRLCVNGCLLNHDGEWQACVRTDHVPTFKAHRPDRTGHCYECRADISMADPELPCPGRPVQPTREGILANEEDAELSPEEMARRQEGHLARRGMLRDDDPPIEPRRSRA